MTNDITPPAPKGIEAQWQPATARAAKKLTDEMARQASAATDKKVATTIDTLRVTQTRRASDRVEVDGTIHTGDAFKARFTKMQPQGPAEQQLFSQLAQVLKQATPAA